jgi:hypothetical protein
MKFTAPLTTLVFSQTALASAVNVRAVKTACAALIGAFLLSSTVLAQSQVQSQVQPQAQQQAQKPTQHDFAALKQADNFWGYFDQYCTECHNSDDFFGSIDFTAYQAADVSENAALFEKVLTKLRGRMMPPPNKIRPDEKQTDAFVAWMETYLDEAGQQHINPTHIAIHRLNRKEYGNAIRDLFGIDIKPKELLPQDSTSVGFDNIAEALSVSPAFIEQYVSAARVISEQVVGDPTPTLGSQIYSPDEALPNRAEGGSSQQFHVKGMPLGTRGGMLIEHWFPTDGEYAVSVGDFNLYAWMYNIEFENKMIVTVDGEKVYETMLGGDKDRIALDLDQGPPMDDINGRTKNIRFTTTAGPHKIGVGFVRRSFAESDDQLQHFIPGSVQDRILSIPSVEVRGPFTVAGMSSTPAREKLFSICALQKQGQDKPQNKDDDLRCAEKILNSTATRAYRRAINADDMTPLLAFFNEGYKTAGFDEGMRRALTRLLASPNFLYRAELTPANSKPADVYALNSIDLASRLSFFLWSSIPDDELLQLAISDKLQDPAVRQAQITRMLADPRSVALAANFASQWLKLDKLDELIPNADIFPYASGAGDLRPDFKEELKLFIDSVFRENQNVMRLVDANYSYLNERLALHYDINDVKGNNFRRVELANSNRWGLLGKGGVLMVTAYPNRTSPVLRGAWILENMMGAPPPLPPANVPALKEDETGKVATTVRERLEQHRENPSCFTCHSVMDPLGFALDNFDAVGRWRNLDRFTHTPVDSSGVMPNGSTVDGPEQLRTALMARPTNFVQGLTEKLLTYALGRELDARDMPVVRQIVRDAAAQDYRFSALVSGIINTTLFTMNTVPSTTIAADQAPAATLATAQP